jgi:hypothetical protein
LAVENSLGIGYWSLNIPQGGTISLAGLAAAISMLAL